MYICDHCHRTLGIKLPISRFWGTPTLLPNSQHCPPLSLSSPHIFSSFLSLSLSHLLFPYSHSPLFLCVSSEICSVTTVSTWISSLPPHHHEWVAEPVCNHQSLARPAEIFKGVWDGTSLVPWEVQWRLVDITERLSMSVFLSFFLL